MINLSNLSINTSKIINNNSVKLNNVSMIYIIINKEQELDRYNYLNKWFGDNKILNYKYVNYCYKNNLTDELVNKYYKDDKDRFKEKTLLNYGKVNSTRSLSKSEISLAINHIKVLEDAVYNNYNSVLILESDAIFSDDFIHKWNDLYSSRLPKNWDIVVLGNGVDKLHYGSVKSILSLQKEKKYVYNNPSYLFRCTEATLFSYNACKKILQTIIPFNAPIDHEYEHNSLENNLNVFLCEPAIIFNGSQLNKYKTEIDITDVTEEISNQMTNNFYSQIGQDKYYVENIIKHRKNGVFLDIGAHDGITFSNTYYLEKYLEWTGICVEPNPNMYKKCKKNRKSILCNKAIYSKSNEKVELIVPCGEGVVEGDIEQLCGLKGHIREKNLKHDFSSQYSKYKTVVVETININDLLNMHNIHTIDYMSIDVEGYELDILKSIDYSKNKIKFITVEHGNDDKYQNNIKQFLESKNYIRHRLNKWDDEYILKNNKPQVNSFDIFDTLLARNVKHPTDIFRIIEEKYKIHNFYKNRIVAEQLSNGTFYDIYKKYQELTNISEQNLIALLNTEIKTEKEHIIPIQCNINKINNGDIIVSDMYLSVNSLVDFLKTIGVNKNVNLYVTPDGKSTGTIWKYLTKEYDILSHIGDNIHSDITMAKKYDIYGIHTTAHRYTKLENILNLELANIIREFRLQNPYEEGSIEFILYDEQCQSNIIILCLFALQICEIMIKENKKRILFTRRDCCLLEKIFAYFFPEKKWIRYYASRIMYKNYNTYYKEYIKKIYDENSIIVDLNGSFNSGRKLYMELFGKLPRVHLLCYNESASVYNGLTYSCLHKIDDYIEVLNSHKCGTLYNCFNDSFFIKHPENNIKYTTIIHDTIDKFINYIDNKNIKDGFIKHLYDIIKDTKLTSRIFSNEFFTYRYNDFLTNKI